MGRKDGRKEREKGEEGKEGLGVGWGGWEVLAPQVRSRLSTSTF